MTNIAFIKRNIKTARKGLVSIFLQFLLPLYVERLNDVYVYAACLYLIVLLPHEIYQYV